VRVLLMGSQHNTLTRGRIVGNHPSRELSEITRRVLQHHINIQDVCQEVHDLVVVS
jgi:hypothetical protein